MLYLSFMVHASESLPPLPLDPLWVPDSATLAHSNIGAAMRDQSLTSYHDFYRWSIEQPEAFWALVIDGLQIDFEKPPRQIVDLSAGPANAQWLPGSALNIAQSCFLSGSDRPAIVHGGSDGDLHFVSYAELRDQAHAIADGLRRLGLQPGDAVAVFLPMTARSVAIYLGILLAGCTVVSIADSFAPEQVAIRLDIGQAKAVFTMAWITRGDKRLPLYDRLKTAQGPRAILADDNLPKEVALRTGDLAWHDFLGEPAGQEIQYGGPDRSINVLFSSGTTGRPKAIPWDQTTAIKAAADGYFHHDIQPGDVVAWPTNLGWMMGPWLIFAALVNRATLALFDGSPLEEHFGRFIQDARVNMLGIVPSIVRHWRQSRCMEAFDWKSIRVFSSTGECSNPEEMRYLSQLAGGRPIIEYCGGTEIGGGYLASTVVQANYASLFSTPALGSGWVILDDEGREADLGEVFLIPPAMGLSHRLLQGDHQAIYYQGVPRGPHGETLRRHGDQVQALQQGYFRAIGRADDTMNLGGIKVGTAEIERALSGIGPYKEIAVIAVAPDGGGPDRLVVCIGTGDELVPDRSQLVAKMQQAIKEHLNPLFKIHDLYVLDHLPRTASNKIVRRQLRSSYVKRHEQETPP